MNILALVGSLRKNSYNMRLAKTIQERYRDRFELNIADIGSLPFFDQDDELNPQQVVVEFKEQVKQADGIVIVTPEYNWSFPAVLKNALDWTSRVDKVYLGKPTLLAGASTGMIGTLRAQLHLRDVLASAGLQANLLPPGQNEFIVTQAAQKFEEPNGLLIDEPTLKFLDDVVGRFIDLVQHH